MGTLVLHYEPESHNQKFTDSDGSFLNSNSNIRSQNKNKSDLGRSNSGSGSGNDTGYESNSSKRSSVSNSECQIGNTVYATVIVTQMGSSTGNGNTQLHNIHKEERAIHEKSELLTSGINEPPGDVDCELDICNAVLNVIDKSARILLIRKVLAIFLLQLLVVASILAVVRFEPDVNAYVSRSSEYYVLFLSMGLISFALGIQCTQFPKKNCCINLIFLVILTIGCGLEIGVLSGCSRRCGTELLMSIGLTSFISLTLLLFSFQNKWDFGRFSICVIGTYSILLLSIFWINKTVRLGAKNEYILTPGVLALLLSGSLAYHLQRISNNVATVTATIANAAAVQTSAVVIDTGPECPELESTFTSAPSKQYISAALSLTVNLTLTLFVAIFVLILFLGFILATINFMLAGWQI